jgi:hypothetical protein
MLVRCAVLRVDTEIRACTTVRVTAEFEYYATPTPMTDLTGCVPNALEGLPDDPVELMKVVRGCVTSADMLTQVYELPAPVGRESEAQTRPVAEMIARMQELDPRPLVESRPPERRFLGNCRHFATMSCALLRHTGTPARVRAGFAGYFARDTWADHWIIEYRSASGDGWVRTDPQLDDDWLEKAGYKATSNQLAQTMYWSGAEAWERCRSGELDPDRCNMGGGANWGIGEVRGSVLYDLAALNKNEMLPWDCWARMEAAYSSETDSAYDELLDTVSEVVTTQELDAIRELYDGNDDLRVPASLLPVSV